MARYTTYEQNAIREDLSNIIYNTDPTEVPFISMVDRGPSATNRFFEWQTDVLKTADGSPTAASVEGSDTVATTATPTVKLRNYQMIFKDAVDVSGTAIAVTTAGRKSELVYQLDLTTKELKRNLEARMTSGHGSAVGDAVSVPRETAGFSAFCSVNKLHNIASPGATDGTTPGFQVGTGLVTDVQRASSTNLRQISHSLLRDIIRIVWDAGGEPTVIMVGSWVKQRISEFPQFSTAQHNVGENFKRNNLVAAFGVYTSDFGVFKIIPNRFQSGQDALLIDVDKVALKYLRNWKIDPLAKTGDSEKRQLLAEVGLEVKAPKAHGKIGDLKTGP